MQCIAFDSHKHYTRRWFRMRRGRCCENSGSIMKARVGGHEPYGLVAAEPQVPPRGRRARSDSRHVTRTAYCCLDSE